MPKKEWPESGWMDFQQWKQETLHRQSEVLEGVEMLTTAILAGQNPHGRIVQESLFQLTETAKRCGLTEEEILQVAENVRHQIKSAVAEQEDDDDDDQVLAQLFSRLMLGGAEPPKHKTDRVPELLAMRPKLASHMIGGQALASKLANQML